MQRSWCRALVAAAFTIATATGVSAATSVSIESVAPGSAAESQRPVVVVRDLPVPLSGATVTVSAHARGLAAPAKLATAFILGGGRVSGTRDRSFRAVIDAPASVLDTLVRDPHATISLTITPNGHPESATTAGPYAVSFKHRSDPS
jgi:hypothetical protein